MLRAGLCVVSICHVCTVAYRVPLIVVRVRVAVFNVSPPTYVECLVSCFMYWAARCLAIDGHTVCSAIASHSLQLQYLNAIGNNLQC